MPVNFNDPAVLKSGAFLVDAFALGYNRESSKDDRRLLNMQAVTAQKIGRVNKAVARANAAERKEESSIALRDNLAALNAQRSAGGGNIAQYRAISVTQRSRELKERQKINDEASFEITRIELETAGILAGLKQNERASEVGDANDLLDFAGKAFKGFNAA